MINVSIYVGEYVFWVLKIMNTLCQVLNFGYMKFILQWLKYTN